ncbi:MAG TPA: hypothetical protein VFG10_08370 [Saprospiraceae bacterium]|nr:hypothetical protein [Saprospiraceae bacterium]
MSLKHELQSVISGNGSVSNGEIIQTITDYLRGKKKAISKVEKTGFNKEQETQGLIDLIETKGLWYNTLDESKYIGEGAEQKIYEYSNPNFVIKLNDSIFYAFWEDYFNSLLIHNYFFPHLAYELLGFYRSEGELFAVVKQPFVKSTESTDLNNVREFLYANGFVNKKENDYHHPELGIIFEDLHDENVLTEDGALQFIDTVFFLMPSFYEKE